MSSYFLSLCSTYYYKNWQSLKRDIGELIFLFVVAKRSRLMKLQPRYFVRLPVKLPYELLTSNLFPYFFCNIMMKKKLVVLVQCQRYACIQAHYLTSLWQKIHTICFNILHKKHTTITLSLSVFHPLYTSSRVSFWSFNAALWWWYSQNIIRKSWENYMLGRHS